jgi:hypothetical protein
MVDVVKFCGCGVVVWVHDMLSVENGIVGLADI